MDEAGGAEPTAPVRPAASDNARGWRRWRLRPISVLILVVFVGITAAATVATRNVLLDQERRLLQDGRRRWPPSSAVL